MYRGVSRLIGDGCGYLPQAVWYERFEVLSSIYGDDYDFYFLHVKKTDRPGEKMPTLTSKVAKLEHVDKLLPKLTAAQS